MNIKIVDSWLREFLDTKATPKEIARKLSLTSVSVERTEKIGDDYVYDIEVTTNRPDLMSVQGIAREAAAVLPEQGISAKFIEPKLPQVFNAEISFPLDLQNDPKLVNRIMAVVMEVEIGESPKKIKDRLEKTGIRSINNVIDVTNYVMREVGHPAHVFDFDLLSSKKMIIRESKPGELLTTLDGKQYRLTGGDIVADDGNGEIIDLLGVMGTANSVVRNNTKRILFFLDNNNPRKIRKTSMNLGIRTEAAIINEKGIDPEQTALAFRRGVELYKEIAKGKVISKTLDIYPNRPKTRSIKIAIEKINNVIGIGVDSKKITRILTDLGFKAKLNNSEIEIGVPTIRLNDVFIDEDIIEEIARVYGYHKLPSTVPTFLNNKITPYANAFYYEERVKNTLKSWGFVEVYSYSLVSEDLYVGPIEKAIKLKNPLSEDMVYLRNSLIPSLIEVTENNKSKENLKIFEISNTYHKRVKAHSASVRQAQDKSSGQDLPEERLTLAGVIKKKNVSFFEAKGLLETLFDDLGISEYKFKNKTDGPGAEVFVLNELIGYIEIFNNNLIDFEINFHQLLKHASLKKTYKPLGKFPAVIEDLTLIIDESISTEELINEIKLQDSLIEEVTLKDQFELSRTFHIIYKSQDRNLTNKEVSEIRGNIISAVQKKFGAQVK